MNVWHCLWIAALFGLGTVGLGILGCVYVGALFHMASFIEEEVGVDLECFIVVTGTLAAVVAIIAFLTCWKPI